MKKLFILLMFLSCLNTVSADESILWYHLNEVSGTNVLDSSTPQYNCTTVNMEDGDWVTAKLNNGLSFDGTNEYANCGNNAGFSKTDPFSLECWVKMTGTSDVILGKAVQGGSFEGYSLQTDASGRPTLSIISGYYEGDMIVVSGTNSIIDNNWYHLVATYDGGELASGVKIYLNGSLETPIVSNDNLLGTITNAVNFQISGRNGANLGLAGVVDEAVVYDYNLSIEEILQRYNSGVGTEVGLGVTTTTTTTLLPTTTTTVIGATTTTTTTIPQDKTISFIVKDINTLTPIENANITVYHIDSSEYLYYLTNAQGIAVSYNNRLEHYYNVSAVSYFTQLNLFTNVTNDTVENIYLTPISTEGLVRVVWTDDTFNMPSRRLCVFYKDNGRLNKCYPKNDTIWLLNNVEYIIEPESNFYDYFTSINSIWNNRFGVIPYVGITLILLYLLTKVLRKK